MAAVHTADSSRPHGYSQLACNVAACHSHPVTTMAVMPSAIEILRASPGGRRSRRNVAQASREPTSISAMRVSVPK